MANEPKLRFAYSGRSIKYVYKIGPQSCMKGSNRVSAYEGPDLAVAYIRDNKQIVARAVVWPAKKRFWTIYFIPQTYEYKWNGGYYQHSGPIGPDYRHMLLKLLKKAGYTCRRLKGARFSKIPAKIGADNYKGFVVPSVDGRKGFKVGTKYITIL